MRDFDSFGSFGRHLGRLASISPAVTERATDAAAEAIEQTAKDEIGAYQAGISGQPAWPQLAPSTLEEKIRQGYATPQHHNPLLRTGELRESISHRTSGNEAEIGSSSQVALYHEFGTSRMPPRPIFGQAVFRAGGRLVEAVGGVAFAWVAGLGWGRGKKLNDAQNHPPKER